MNAVGGCSAINRQTELTRIMKHTVPNQFLSISGWFLVEIGTLRVNPTIILEQKLLDLLNSVKQTNFKT